MGSSRLALLNEILSPKQNKTANKVCGEDSVGKQKCLPHKCENL